MEIQLQCNNQQYPNYFKKKLDKIIISLFITDYDYYEKSAAVMNKYVQEEIRNEILSMIILGRVPNLN